MPERIFESVWFRPGINRWSDIELKELLHAVKHGTLDPSAWQQPSLLAYTDIGTLVVNDQWLEFRGGKGVMHISRIISVTYGKQGRDFVNNWVQIEFGEDSTPLTAFFADGSRRGWGGVLGGTKRIFNAVNQVMSVASKTKTEADPLRG